MCFGQVGLGFRDWERLCDARSMSVSINMRLFIIFRSANAIVMAASESFIGKSVNMPHSPECSLVDMVEGFLVTQFSIYILHAVPFIINHSLHRGFISMVFSELIVYNSHS